MTLISLVKRSPPRAKQVSTLRPALPAKTPDTIDIGGSHGEDRVEGRFARFVTATFFLCVLLPTLSFLAYLLLWASPQYVAEVRMIVRSTEKADAIAEGLSILKKFTGKDASSSSQDGQIIISYIKSRAVIEDVGGRELLAKVFGRSDIDYWSRLPADASYEKIEKYWQNRVSASINTVSNIITMRAKGYSPEDAKLLAQKVLDKSEALINRMADRSRQDALRRAATEVDRAAEELAKQRQAVLDFRNRAGTIDPLDEVKEISTVVFNLTLQKIELEAQSAAVAGSIDRNSVTERQRRGQIEAISKQIDDLKAKLTNSESLAIAAEKIRQYEQVKLRSEFAERIYEISKKEYETARQNLERQHF
ncbi:MAG: hypothetical protein RKP46_19695, partial [Candidatus Accumulibacter sp.]|uniref:hypothetical protein n=1 Tax=Accumulibacter sp. TaxID=2053492 RepID=UPI0028781939